MPDITDISSYSDKEHYASPWNDFPRHLTAKQFYDPYTAVYKCCSCVSKKKWAGFLQELTEYALDIDSITLASPPYNLFKIDSINPKTEMREPFHIHPKQQSSAKVLSGKLHFLVNGKEQVVVAGEEIVIPAGSEHCFWNEDDMVAHSVQRFSPALHIDEFFETLFALANHGKLSEKGMPPFLYLPLMGLKHKDEIRVPNPPWAIQLLTYCLLAPVSFLLGYRAGYRKKEA